MEQQNQQVPPAPAAQPDDIQKNKTIAMFSYIIFFLPLVTDAKNSPFAKFHANQGLLLLIAGFALNIAWWIFSAIIFAISFRLGLALSFISWLVSLAILALVIIGMISANNGETKPLPVIGKMATIIK